MPRAKVWMAAILRTFPRKAFVLASVASTLLTFVPPLSPRFIPHILSLVLFGSFLWANFAAYMSLWEQKEKLEAWRRITRVSVEYRDGWYDARGPNPADTQGSLHFRLQLVLANRDDRATTVSFREVTVPGQSNLRVTRAHLVPATIGVHSMTPALQTIHLTDGQTVAATLEIDIWVPNIELSAWGPSVDAILHFNETYGGDLRPLRITVPHTT